MLRTVLASSRRALLLPMEGQAMKASHFLRLVHNARPCVVLVAVALVVLGSGGLPAVASIDPDVIADGVVDQLDLDAWDIW